MVQCSTPYGIRGLCMGEAAPFLRGTGVLNALRHQRTVHSTRQDLTNLARRGSAQRLTASEDCASESVWAISKEGKSAQRLTASEDCALADQSAINSFPTVLNALRHQRTVHWRSANFPSVFNRAQRLTASEDCAY